ncbi:hypothetical protein JDV02_009795 [Purpureocillium takamizusanense]|uniref:Uncharacterized protein n=1 Tax=Purpureocillium takamizusanense TaxID=2060973 RepID=A0A9Q8QQP9_9HYPO|nr:uncharacterized protein JDV02_009795 [Purpureocillium takamizusanense]UNI24015.1 hypothetical protein JDV02_009795 [Purpureocillium takamizusanense]
MEEGLTPSQKAQLHEVADGMLKVYQTLVRMRYLDASLIQEGPHDIDHLMPLYRSLGLDPSIVYLYSILPYVAGPGDGGGGGGDFFLGGEFVDFRKEDDVRQGRDPFYSEAVEDAMRPWMTPLSGIGNHGTALLYDARKHCIGIFDQMNSGSCDHNLHEGYTIRRADEGDEEAEEHGEQGSDGEGSAEGAQEEDADGEDDEDHGSENDEDDEEEGKEEDDDDEDNLTGDEDEGDDDDDDDDDDEHDSDECWLDIMDSRPAPNVLRDMALWLEDLTELPGGGEQSDPQWSPDIIKPLYIKHGWPHAHFNGDAFLVDQARAQAVLDARSAAEEPRLTVERLRDGRGGNGDDDDEGDSPAVRRLRERLRAATTPDDEWAARWELWRAEWRERRRMQCLREAEAELERVCPGGVCQKPDELILWELRQLREDLLSAERTLKSCQQELGDADASTDDDDTRRSLQIQLRQAESRAATCRRAYEACEADAQRECPGKAPLPLGRGVETTGLDLEQRQRDLSGQAEGLEEEIGLIREWVAGLPDKPGVQTARDMARARVEQSEEQLQSTKWQLGCVVKDLEGL